MPTNAEIISAFFDPLMAHSPKLPGEDRNTFLKDLIEALREFSREALTLARQEFIRTRKFQTFPSVAECLTMVRRFEAVGSGKGGILSDAGFHKAALGYIQAKGGGAALSPMREDDQPGWCAWRAYLEQIGAGRYAGMMSKVERGHFSNTDEMTFPSALPIDFDASAPSSVRCLDALDELRARMNPRRGGVSPEALAAIRDAAVRDWEENVRPGFERKKPQPDPQKKLSELYASYAKGPVEVSIGEGLAKKLSMMKGEDDGEA